MRVPVRCSNFTWDGVFCTNNVYEVCDNKIYSLWFGARAGDGTGAIGKVVDRKRDPDGNPKGTPHSNPLLDTREYVVRFLDDHEETYTANVIAENLFAWSPA